MIHIQRRVRNNIIIELPNLKMQNVSYTKKVNTRTGLINLQTYLAFPPLFYDRSVSEKW